MKNDGENRLKKSGAVQYSYQAAIDHLPYWFVQKIRRDGASSCDWICSTGEGTDLLANRLNIRVVGVDSAADAIEVARRKYAKPDFLVADYLCSDGGVSAAEYDILFAINTLEFFACPAKVLADVAAKARKYVVVLIPYREYLRRPDHVSTFDQGNIPLSVAGRFTLVYSRVMDMNRSAGTDAEGEHILLIYASEAEICTLGLVLGDLEIGRESIHPGVQLQRLRGELKAANQLFLDRTYLLEQQLGAREAELLQRNQEISDLRGSTSWRVTAPIRGMGRAARSGKKKIQSTAYLAYRRTPLPEAWKSALRRVLSRGAALPVPPAAITIPPDVSEGKPAVVPRFVPPLRGSRDREDVFIWGHADWHSLTFRSQQIALGMAHQGHRTYFFSSRFVDDDKPGFRLEAVSRDGLLNVVHLNAASPQSIHDEEAVNSSMAQCLRASLAMFLVQAAATSIVSMMQHPFWLEFADQVPNRHLIYDMMIDDRSLGDGELELKARNVRAIREADAVLAAAEDLALIARGYGAANVLLLPGDDDRACADHARAIIQHVDQYVPPLVSVVLVTYNKLELTEACLRSLEKNTQHRNFEIIVVDNDSHDATPEYLKEWVRGGENRRIILNADNRGFAAGNNQGLRIARGEYLVLLNNDTYVTAGWLGTLVRHLERDPVAGIVGPVTNNIGNESKIDISYDSMEEMEGAARRYTATHMGETLALHTAAFFCVAFRREIYEKVGDLDEAFGIGMFEDDDYCRRVQQIGFTVSCAEDVFIHHHLSASFNLLGMERRVKLFTENRKLYESKWGPWVPHEYRKDFGRKH